jgi:beta-galactosidase GanA
MIRMGSGRSSEYLSRMQPHWMALGVVALLAVVLPAQAEALPRLERRDGRHALIVDGEPFLMLGVQANNSSNYPAMLPKVWPMLERLHANTLEIPVAWEQVEPSEGKFDFSWLDALIREARKRDKRLVLLWFATWKNTGPSYAPSWVEANTARFPRMRTRDGKQHYVLSPHHRATLEADKRAFVAMLRHVKKIDRDHRVILVQPQNEVGSYGQLRDYAPEAEALFDAAVPEPLARATGKSGTWLSVYGPLADSAFNAWHTARYIDEIAAAGKAVLDLPMYCNAALSDAFAQPGKGGGASGGPDWQLIDVWKSAAPHIDFLAPDIYNRDARAYAEYLRLYARPDNALMIPETGNAADYARFFWLALGKGAIGFAPFGFDATGYSNYPLGAKEIDAATIEAFASKYALFAPMARTWAKIALAHPTWGAVKGADAADQSTLMGHWRVTLQFDLWQFGERDWKWLKGDPPATVGKAVGGAVLAQLGPDEFLVAGSNVRVRIALDKFAPEQAPISMQVEEGRFDARGKWQRQRIWNGDQTDYGLNFIDVPTLLRVVLMRNLPVSPL